MNNKNKIFQYGSMFISHNEIIREATDAQPVPKEPYHLATQLGFQASNDIYCCNPIFTIKFDYLHLYSVNITNQRTILTFCNNTNPPSLTLRIMDNTLSNSLRELAAESEGSDLITISQRNPNIQGMKDVYLNYHLGYYSIDIGENKIIPHKIYTDMKGWKTFSFYPINEVLDWEFIIQGDIFEYTECVIREIASDFTNTLSPDLFKQTINKTIFFLNEVIKYPMTNPMVISNQFRETFTEELISSINKGQLNLIKQMKERQNSEIIKENTLKDRINNSSNILFHIKRHYLAKLDNFRRNFSIDKESNEIEKHYQTVLTLLQQNGMYNSQLVVTYFTHRCEEIFKNFQKNNNSINF